MDSREVVSLNEDALILILVLYVVLVLLLLVAFF